jgi:hypothetical protein
MRRANFFFNIPVRAFVGNPYDGHTIEPLLGQMEVNQCITGCHCMEFKENDGKAQRKFFVFHFSLVLARQTRLYFS